MGGRVASFKSQLGGLAGTFGVAFGAAAIIGAAKGIIELGSGITDLAAQTGLTTREVQALEQASLKAGVAPEKMRTAVTSLTRAVSEASSGTQTYVDAFNALGIKVEDIAGKDIGEIFEKVSVAVADSQGSVEAMGEASVIFGSRVTAQFSEVFQQIEETGGSLEGLAKQFEDGIIGDEELQRLDAAADAMERMKREATAFIVETGSKIAGVVSEFATFAGAAFEAMTNDAITLEEALLGVVENQMAAESEAAKQAEEEEAKKKERADAAKQRIKDQKAEKDAAAAEVEQDKIDLAQAKDAAEVARIQERINQRAFQQLALTEQRAQLEEEIAEIQSGDTSDLKELDRIKILDDLTAKEVQLAGIREAILREEEAVQKQMARDADRLAKEQLKATEDTAQVSIDAASRLAAVGGFGTGDSVAGSSLIPSQFDRLIGIQEKILEEANSIDINTNHTWHSVNLVRDTIERLDGDVDATFATRG
jgi:hypothetical protein